MANINENGKFIGRPTKDGRKEEMQYLRYLDELRENMKKETTITVFVVIGISMLLCMLFNTTFFLCIGLALAALIYILSYPGALLFVLQSISFFLIYIILCFVFKLKYVEKLGSSLLFIGFAVSLFLLYRETFFAILGIIVLLFIFGFLLFVWQKAEPVFVAIGQFFCNYWPFIIAGILIIIAVLCNCVWKVYLTWDCDKLKIGFHIFCTGIIFFILLGIFSIIIRVNNITSLSSIAWASSLIILDLAISILISVLFWKKLTGDEIALVFKKMGFALACYIISSAFIYLILFILYKTKVIFNSFNLFTILVVSIVTILLPVVASIFLCKKFFEQYK